MTNTSNRPVRVRFAPSPTGLLHIGGLRTALYNYLFAKQQGGQLILRIEDTDQERFVPGAEEDILDSLVWDGLPFTEGPGIGGPHVPYHQSKREALYRTYAEQLLEAGNAYYAFDTKADLEEMRDRLTQSGNNAPRYDTISRMSMTNSLTLSQDEVQRRLDGGEPYVVRLKVPRRETIRFNDLVRGWVSFESGTLDDQVLLKSDGLPTYHLANVVDDHLMQISHVIRGEEWLPSTPKHILLYQFFGWEPPTMAHLPLILSPNGGKLSKRNADKMGIPVSVKQYREAGYEPEALLNFLAFLGWNPGTEQEVFTLDELETSFDFSRVGSAGVQFNLDKLRWYNEQFIRRMSVSDLAKAAQRLWNEQGMDVDAAYAKAIVGLLQERISLVKDLATVAQFFFEDPSSYDPKGLKRWKADSSDLVLAYADRLDALGDTQLTAATAKVQMEQLVEAHGIKFGQIMAPARLALTGLMSGPGLFEIMEVLGTVSCIRRLRAATEALVNQSPAS
jgi:glutamyl-tRNA synthetase